MIPIVFSGKLLDFLTARGTGTKYAALVAAQPGVGDTPANLVEITTAGYARQPVTFGVPAVPVDGSSDLPVTTNAAQVTFGPFTANMAVAATHIVLLDAASGTTGDIRYVWEIEEGYLGSANASLLLPANSMELGA